MPLLGAVVLVAGAASPARAEEAGGALRPPGLSGWQAWPVLSHDVWTAPSGRVVLDRWSVAWPLLQAWSAPASEGAGFAAAWPLVAAEWAPAYLHWRALPLAAYWRWEDERLLAVAPLGILSLAPQRWTLLAPFCFVQRDPATFRFVLWPAAWWFDEPAGGLRSLWPVFHLRWRGPPGGARRWHLDLLPASLLPVGAWWADADRDDVYLGVGWPVVFGYRARGDRWSMRILLEGLVCWSDGAGHVGWRVFGGLFAYESRGAAWVRWSVLWGLFTREITDRTVATGVPR